MQDQADPVPQILRTEAVRWRPIGNEQTRKHGMTREAAAEVVRICKDRNVLKEYLAQREKEVVTIMMSLFDEEEIMKSYIRSERYDAEREATKRNAITMLKMGRISLDEILSFFPELTSDDIEEIEKEVMQLA